MLKKGLLLILAISMLLGPTALANDKILGFGGEWASGSWGVSSLPVAEGDPIHVSVMFPRRAMHPESFDDMWWCQELLTRANVVFDWILVEQSGFQEKKNLVLAAGDYPDIFIDGITKTDEQTFGPQKIFVDLAPLIDEYAPNMKELFERYPDVRKSITYPGGAIYNMPDFSIVPRDQFVSAPYFNEKWLENLGVDEPTTLDELYNVLMAVKDGDADLDGDANNEIPLMYVYETQYDFKYLVLAANGLIGLLDDQKIIADYVKDGQYLFIPIEDGYKNYLEYMNRLYDAELLDPESFTISGEQANAKVQSKNVFMINGTPYGVMPNDEDWMQYDMIGSITVAEGDPLVWPGTKRHTRDWGNFVMTDKCKYPEEMVRLQDYFYTDVGSLMIRAGREADTYDEFGWKLIIDTEEPLSWHSIITYDTSKFDNYYNWRMNNSPLQGTYVAGEFHNKVMISSDYKNNWYSETKLGTGRMDYATIPYPEVTFTDDEQSTLMIYVDIANYVKQMEAKFITGETPISEWDNYVSTIKNMGIDSIVEVKQAAYDRWNQN